jgi:hypothetical protein
VLASINEAGSPMGSLQSHMSSVILRLPWTQVYGAIVFSVRALITFCYNSLKEVYKYVVGESWTYTPWVFLSRLLVYINCIEGFHCDISTHADNIL